MADHDLIIRNGTIVDGTGETTYEGDIAINGGTIAEIGKVSGAGTEEIDAKGMIVTPGFVDVHTHYDGQATWAQRLDPSSWHGVTTAVMGNCGVGFAPCKPEDHLKLIHLMEGVEDIPEVVMTEGLKWNWETFPEFLNALEALPHDMDFATQVPHGALRVYVMGQRGADREPATADDIAKMAALARQGVEAGALGFSTSRTINHRTSTGEMTPTFAAEAAELIGIAAGLNGLDRGVLQVVTDFKDTDQEFEMFRQMVKRSGCPLSISVAQTEPKPNLWREFIERINHAVEGGYDMRAQVCGRPVGILLGLELSMNPFTAFPKYKDIKDLPLDQRVAALKDPEFRKQIFAQQPRTDHPFLRALAKNFHKIFVLGDPPNYEPHPSESLGERAKAQNRDPYELALDEMLKNDGKALLYFPFLNYADNSLDPSYEMMTNKNTIMGLGDGGAHLGSICDSSFTTTLLTHWTRDRTRGPKLDLEWVVKAHTQDTASAVGLMDRGLIKPGYKADLNVIDYDHLTLQAPQVVHDLPAGGRRLVQRSQGYAATIVNGQITYREGEATEALPGQLIRGAKAAPQLP